jgi:GGDEF domain-containing protein
MLTFSVGLALLADCDQASDLVRCADEAMYRAKNSGGDTIVKTVCGAKQQDWLEDSRII